MRPFRLGLLNPNTDEDDTRAMAEIAARVLSPEADVVAVTAARGPRSIESYVDAAVAAAEVVGLMRAHPGLDAYLVACFGDPGVNAARELTDAPVVGIGEAALGAACLVARRFAVLTTLARSVPELEDALEAQGIVRRCVGVIPLSIPVAEQGAKFPATTTAMVAAGRRAIEELGAEALVLACGGMAEVAAAVREAVGVPVCDGVSFGALLAYSLWRAGLTTSKAGSLAWPEPIPYVGMPGFAGEHG